MANNRNRYKQFELKMTLLIILNALLLLSFLVVAALGITWLKIVLAVLCGLLAATELGFLYLNQEIGKPRSLWMTVSAVCILICMTVSLVLNYPN